MFIALIVNNAQSVTCISIPVYVLRMYLRWDSCALWVISRQVSYFGDSDLCDSFLVSFQGWAEGLLTACYINLSAAAALIGSILFSSHILRHMHYVVNLWSCLGRKGQDHRTIAVTSCRLSLFGLLSHNNFKLSLHYNNLPKMIFQNQFVQ